MVICLECCVIGPGGPISRYQARLSVGRCLTVASAPGSCTDSVKGSNRACAPRGEWEQEGWKRDRSTASMCTFADTLSIKLGNKT
eukprot:430443-Amphidinium_carterae.1